MMGVRRRMWNWLRRRILTIFDGSRLIGLSFSAILKQGKDSTFLVVNVIFRLYRTENGVSRYGINRKFANSLSDKRSIKS